MTLAIAAALLSNWRRVRSVSGTCAVASSQQLMASSSTINPCWVLYPIAKYTGNTRAPIIAPGVRSFAHVTSGRILERTARSPGSGGQRAGGLSLRCRTLGQPALPGGPPGALQERRALQPLIR